MMVRIVLLERVVDVRIARVGFGQLRNFRSWSTRAFSDSLPAGRKWLIFQAYHHYQHDAIFLAGLPRRTSSRLCRSSPLVHVGSLLHQPLLDQIVEQGLQILAPGFRVFGKRPTTDKASVSFSPTTNPANLPLIPSTRPPLLRGPVVLTPRIVPDVRLGVEPVPGCVGRWRPRRRWERQPYSR